MSVIFGKFMRSAIPNCQSNLVRFLSASQFKLSERDVEEIEIPVPWGHIAGKWWGDKSSPPVLAIHGWQDNANSFDRLIPLLNVPSILAIDLPGHGLSSNLLEGKAYDFSEHIILLQRIKKYFNWEQIPLLTHSLGAAIGYGYAAMFPDNIKWVVNLECSRSLITLLRQDINNIMAKAIDGFLKIEKLKKGSPPPAYKLSKMIEMTIEGSLGSIASPEAAAVLLKRGVQVTEKPNVRTDDKIPGKWWGPKDRRPILCIHGWQDNANSFNTLIPQLSSQFSYLAIDLPGHGLSSHYPKGFFYKTYEAVCTVRRVQHYFNWNNVSLIGHSFGAICSFVFSSLFSNSVDIFVAIDCIKPSSKNSEKDIKQAPKRVEKLLQYEALDVSSAPSYTKEELMKIWIKGTDASLTEDSCKLLMERGARESNGMYRVVRDPRVKQNFGINFTHKEILKLAEAVTCNVLFLKATDAKYFEKKENVLDVLAVLKKRAKYFEEHLLTGTHHIHLNNPEIVAPVINAFIQTVGGQR